MSVPEPAAAAERQPAPVRVGVVGLGYWGPNLARNLAAIPGCRAGLAVRRLHARARASGALLPQRADDRRRSRICSATTTSTRSCWPRPFPPTPSLPSRSQRAGKHCFVEKPLATNAADAQRAVAAAEQAGRILMVGHLLEYHPAVTRLKELIDGRRARRAVLHLRQPPEPRQAARRRERAVEPRRARRLRRAAPGRRRARRVPGPGRLLRARGRAGRRLLLPALPLRDRRPPAPVLAGPAQGAAHDRRRRHAGWRPSTTCCIEGKLTLYDKGFDEDTRSWGEYIARSGDTFSPRIPNVEPLRIECEHFLECVRTGAQPRSDGHSGLRVVRVLERLQHALDG